MSIRSYLGPKKIRSLRPRDYDWLKTFSYEVQEKIDGSQFSFMLEDGVLRCKSRKVDIVYSVVDGEVVADSSWKGAIQNLINNIDQIAPGIIYRGEVLRSHRHNKICYNRAPKGNLVLFEVESVDGKFLTNSTSLANIASQLGVDYAPFIGSVKSLSEYTDEAFMDHLENSESVLGGRMEGVVLKSFQGSWYGYRDGTSVLIYPSIKFVCPEFMERTHKKTKGKSSIQDYIKDLGDSLKNTNRWDKAIQHLRESGELTGTVKDIGPLIKEIHTDISLEEDADLIKLLKRVRKHVLKKSTKGFAEYYKNMLEARSPLVEE